MSLPNYKQIQIDLIKNYTSNSRTHSDDQVQQVVNSINEFGFTNPILIDENNVIIAGHCRVEAAKRLHLTQLPCIILAHLSETQKRAYVIADNKLALNAGWDMDVLRAEFELLREADFNIELTGFTLDELIEILPDDEVEVFCDEDDCPNVPDEPIAKLGDVWLLGEHRLMCGDSTSIDAVEKLMAGAKADMVFTDPPYGVNFKQGHFCGQTKAVKARNFTPIANDNKQVEELKNFLKEIFLNLTLVSDVCSIYAWSPPLAEGFSILNALIETDWHMQSQIIWNKSSMVIGRSDYHWKHEVCWYGYRGKHHKWYGGRNKVSVWDVKKQMVSDLHPTMKPVELAETACQNSTNSGDNVLDVFGGSGSTLIACEKLKRKCFMMELDPRYVDVIIARYEQYTGKKAILED